MMKHHLVNRDFKTPLNSRRYQPKNTRLTAMLLGTVFLLGIIVYFKYLSQPDSSALASKKHIISIDLPNNSSDELSEAETTSLKSTLDVTNKTHEIDTNTVQTSKVTPKQYTIKPGDSLAKIFKTLNYYV